MIPCTVLMTDVHCLLDGASFLSDRSLINAPLFPRPTLQASRLSFRDPKASIKQFRCFPSTETQVFYFCRGSKRPSALYFRVFDPEDHLGWIEYLDSRGLWESLSVFGLAGFQAEACGRWCEVRAPSMESASRARTTRGTIPTISSSPSLRFGIFYGSQASGIGSGYFNPCVAEMTTAREPKS